MSSPHQFVHTLEFAGLPASGKAFSTGAGFLVGWGLTVPSAEAGYAPGAIFFHTDGTAGNQQYVNEGTKTSSSFVRQEAGDIAIAAGESMTLVDDATVVLGTGSDITAKWNGTYLEFGPTAGMWAGAPSPADPNYEAVATRFFDDFNKQAPLDANLIWFEIDDAGTGTNAIIDAANGVGSIVTAAADNDHHAITSLAESWLFAEGKKLWFEVRLKLAEATTNDSAWWVGLTDTLTTGGFQANAGGPLASYDGALIWKDEDTLVVDFETSNAGTQATLTNLGTAVSDQWHTVGFYFDGVATTSTITPYLDGTAGTAQNITLAGLEEMHLVLGVKAGPGGAAETLQVDYVKVIQLR